VASLLAGVVIVIGLYLCVVIDRLSTLLSIQNATLQKQRDTQKKLLSALSDISANSLELQKDLGEDLSGISARLDKMLWVLKFDESTFLTERKRLCDAQVDATLKDGNKIRAIRIYMQYMGVSLGDASDHVDALLKSRTVGGAPSAA
jgi:ribosomal protein L7/L12